VQWGVTRSYIRVDTDRKGFTTDFYTVWDAHKFRTWPKCFLRRIVAHKILSTNWHVLRCGWNRVDTVLIPYGPGSKSGCVWQYYKITTHSAHFHPDQIRIVTMNVMRYAIRVDAVLRCGLKRVDAVRTGSIWILIRNWNPCKNFWTWPKKFFSPYRSRRILRNLHGLQCGWNRVDTVMIPYGPGSKSGCVWL
jgi:hypothetical protein